MTCAHDPESQSKASRIGELARLAHVSVRALHHYDRIGLVRPSARTASGYRLYATEDLERLQTVLLYKELGFGLGEIRDMLALIDKTLAALDEGIPMERNDMFEVFGDFDPAEHEAEAEARWGETEAYKESARRTRLYTKEDWAQFKAESTTVNEALALLMDEGVAPDDPRAMDAVERHRVLIDTWFYPCTAAAHEQLGRMYVDDARFAATYEKIRPGMAAYLRDATAANAARASRGSQSHPRPMG